MSAKRVLITGASSGIGLQLAKDYQAAGWQTIACGRDETRLAQARASQTLQFDIEDREQTIAAADKLTAPIDLLILNAGTCEYIDDAIHFDSQLLSRVLTTNVIGLGHCLEAFLKHLDHRGQLALIGSAASLLPFSRAEAYGASKAAVTYLAASLRVDLKPQQIDVSLVQPGFVDTPLTEKNNFQMPGMITSKEASSAIRAGLEKRKNVIRTPWLFNRLLGLIGGLPDPLPMLIASRMRQS